MNRIGKLREYMREQEINLVIIESEVNRFYFTEVRCNMGTLLITVKEALLILDPRFSESAKKVAINCEVVESKDRDIFLYEFMRKNKGKRVATEEEYITAKRRNELKTITEYRVIDSLSLDNKIKQMRRKKDSKEVKYLRKAQYIADETFLHMLEFIEPGRTENDLKVELGITMVKLGSENYSMNFLVAAGENSGFPHGGVKNRRIEKGDFVTMDFGGCVHGYSSDMTRTVAVGEISEERKLVYQVVKEAQEKAMRKLAPNVPCVMIDSIARDVIGSYGYQDYFGHGLGHSLGLEIHENPRCNETSKEKLEPYDIMTIEPGIYLPNRFGVRIEDMVVITEDGYENLTTSERDLIIL